MDSFRVGSDPQEADTLINEENVQNFAPELSPQEVDALLSEESPSRIPNAQLKMTEAGVEDSMASTSATTTSEDTGDVIVREKWKSKTEFLLSVAGGFVGLGNVWRFPYLCYKNGGGAFLIPYGIFLLLGGIPIFFLEVALGQYLSEGGITSWMRLAPITAGIGYASMVIVALLNIYYIVILAWAIFYLIQSFTSELPWATCGNYWNTACCSDFKNSSSSGNGTAASVNASLCTGEATSSELEYWENRVLGLSAGLHEPGQVRWELALCLLAAWVICYFCIWKGVKSTGKVVYFTATFPFLMLIVFVVRGVTLPGAMTGIKFYLTPNMTKLQEAEVWIDAGTQIFFSFAICLGALISLGSYNLYNNNCYRDCVLLSLLNSGTSFISGFAVFSVLGFMAEEQGRDISKVARSGPGLAFIAYPKAITLMPGATAWSILFFIMILLLGLDSQFVETEGFITSIVDLFPKKLRKGYNREIFIAITCGLSYLVALSMVTNGGMYVFQLFDTYAASGVCLLWVAFCECVAVSWIYGGERMWQNVTRMVGFRPIPIMKWIWTIGTPLLVTATFFYSMVKFKPPTYGEYVYPPWGVGIGWCLALSSMLVVPIYAVGKLLVTPGTLKERWDHLTTPVLARDHPDFGEHVHTQKTSIRARVFDGKFTNVTAGGEEMKVMDGRQVATIAGSMDRKAEVEKSAAVATSEPISDPPSYNDAVEGGTHF